jgi:hypothetical protein
MTDQLARRQFLRRITGGAVGIGLTSTQVFAASEEWKAGFAEVSITPGGSLWMGGYANRTKPSDGVALELHAKALALKDRSGARAVMVTTDLLGLPAVVSHNIAERAQKRYNLERDRLLLSSSHTHSGPVIDGMLKICYPLNAQQDADIKAYTSEMEDKIVNLIGQSLKSLHPARLSFGHAEADFGVNRRVKTPSGYVIGVNKEGPADHDVPILRVDDKHGKLKGLVFGYACHNTAAKAYHQFNGDYAGFAQAQLENQHHGAVALFVAGCAGDQNPYPRGSIEHAQLHGEELAAAVEKSMSRPFEPVGGPLKTAYEEFPVAFGVPPSREKLQAQLHSTDLPTQKWAESMLQILDRDGHLPTEYPYPLTVWQFGKDMTLIALAGEDVVDYDLRLKKEFGAEKLWVAAYCNDVFAYIPSLRVLKEGGYEGGGSMVYYGHPCPFSPAIEETVIGKVHELVSRVRS